MLNIHNQLEQSVRDTAVRLWPESREFQLSLQEPTIAEHGDLATNIAMQLAPKLKKKPLEIAQELADQCATDYRFRELVDRAEVKPPGFVNFFLKSVTLAGELQTFCAQLHDVDRKMQKIVIEHTNVNPNKAMHIGHLRNAVLGDAIRRILLRMGYLAEVQYYVDDTGVQVADTYLGMRELKMRRKNKEKFDHFCWRVYTAINEAYEAKPEYLKMRTQVMREIEDQSSETAGAVNQLARKILREHLRTMAAFTIGYDVLVWESDILKFGIWARALKMLKKSDDFVYERSGKNAGCWVLKMDSDQQSDEYSADKVIIKSDKTVTYTGKDIAYHLWKFDLLDHNFLYSKWRFAPQERELYTTDVKGRTNGYIGQADSVYNVIDVRQAYPQQVVKRALERLGFENESERIRHVAYGVVSLAPKTMAELGIETDDSKYAYSMSGRKGVGVKVDDVLQAVEEHVQKKQYAVESARRTQAISPADVAAGAIKYFMLRYNPQTEIVFDYEEALSLDGNTGPYIQYAHARAAGILEKAQYTELRPFQGASFAPEEHRVLKRLYLWPSVLERTSEDLAINALTQYAFELATAFNAFYEASPVMKAEGALREQRLAIVFACHVVLRDVLHLLGIVAPDRM